MAPLEALFSPVGPQQGSPLRSQHLPIRSPLSLRLRRAALASGGLRLRRLFFRPFSEFPTIRFSLKSGTATTNCPSTAVVVEGPILSRSAATPSASASLLPFPLCPTSSYASALSSAFGYANVSQFSVDDNTFFLGTANVSAAVPPALCRAVSTGRVEGVLATSLSRNVIDSAAASAALFSDSLKVPNGGRAEVVSNAVVLRRAGGHVAPPLPAGYGGGTNTLAAMAIYQLSTAFAVGHGAVFALSNNIISAPASTGARPSHLALLPPAPTAASVSFASPNASSFLYVCGNTIYDHLATKVAYLLPPTMAMLTHSANVARCEKSTTTATLTATVSATVSASVSKGSPTESRSKSRPKRSSSRSGPTPTRTHRYRNGQNRPTGTVTATATAAASASVPTVVPSATAAVSGETMTHSLRRFGVSPTGVLALINTDTETLSVASSLSFLQPPTQSSQATPSLPFLAPTKTVARTAIATTTDEATTTSTLLTTAAPNDTNITTDAGAGDGATSSGGDAGTALPLVISTVATTVPPTATDGGSSSSTTANTADGTEDEDEVTANAITAITNMTTSNDDNSTFSPAAVPTWPAPNVMNAPLEGTDDDDGGLGGLLFAAAAAPVEVAALPFPSPCRRLELLIAPRALLSPLLLRHTSSYSSSDTDAVSGGVFADTHSSADDEGWWQRGALAVGGGRYQHGLAVGVVVLAVAALFGLATVIVGLRLWYAVDGYSRFASAAAAVRFPATLIQTFVFLANGAAVASGMILGG